MLAIIGAANCHFASLLHEERVISLTLCGNEGILRRKNLPNTVSLFHDVLEVQHAVRIR